jgi:hypothetical protein
MEHNYFKKEEETVFNLTDEIRPYLHETARWGKFLAIMGIILLSLIGIFMAAMTMKVSTSNFMGTSVSLIPMIIMMLVMGTIYVFPIIFLFRFSTKIRRWLQQKDEAAFVKGFANLKMLFQYIGILTIIMICAYGLILLFMIPAMMMMMK